MKLDIDRKGIWQCPRCSQLFYGGSMVDEHYRSAKSGCLTDAEMKARGWKCIWARSNPALPGQVAVG